MSSQKEQTPQIEAPSSDVINSKEAESEIAKSEIENSIKNGGLWTSPPSEALDHDFENQNAKARAAAPPLLVRPTTYASSASKAKATQGAKATEAPKSLKPKAKRKTAVPRTRKPNTRKPKQKAIDTEDGAEEAVQTPEEIKEESDEEMMEVTDEQDVVMRDAEGEYEVDADVIEGHAATAAVLNGAAVQVEDIAVPVAQSVSAFKNGDIRDGWVYDEKFQKFFPPPCAKANFKDWDCTQCGRKRLQDHDMFFAGEDGGRLKTGQWKCIKCLKRLWDHGKWKNFPKAPWEKKDGDESGKPSGGSGNGSSVSV